MPDKAERPPGRRGAQDGAGGNVNHIVTGASHNPTAVDRDLDVARVLAAAGVPVFVAYPDPGKPAGYRFPGGWETTAANPGYIKAWKPGLALCAVMGQGLDLIDIDPRNGGALAALDGLLPEVYAAAATPSGGMHLFVKSMGVRSLDDVLPGIDVKAGDPDGNGRGLAFIAPTVRVSKTTGERVAYCWTSPDIDLPGRLENAADDTSGAPLAELIRSKHGRQDNRTGTGWTDPDIDALIEHGITEGGQDVQLRDTVWKLRGRNLSKPVVRSAWRSIVAKTPLKDPPRPWTEADFERHWQGADRKQESAVPGTSPRTGRHRARSGEQSDPRPAEPLSELGYARRLIAVYGDRIRYVPAWRRWLIWDGQRWAHDSTGQAARWAKSIARRVTADAIAAGSQVSLARRDESSAGIAGALTLAGTEEGVVVTPDDLDANPFLLNCPNGILDLRTGQLGPHDPGQMLTKMTGAPYDPAAAGPEFTKFLERVQPDPAMRAYLARLLGHALEGRVITHILPIFHGAGANGKGTLTTAVLAALGDYGDAADPELLTARTFDAHPTGTADLYGLRLAVLHESDHGRRLAEGTVKRLTGGDRIKARRMREDFWSFDPSHTFLMLTNHKPIIGGTDEGIWRRLRLVPWDVVIPQEERDEELGDRLHLELGHVLAWLVGGYQDWQARGLADPDQVRSATDAYRAESDAIGRFIEQRCLTGPNFRVRSSELFMPGNSGALPMARNQGLRRRSRPSC
jgi:putative DNA primase/helicase